MPRDAHRQLKKTATGPRFPLGSDFQDILSLIGDAVVSTDDNGLIIMFNLAAEGVFGYSSAEVLGQSIDILIPVQFQDQHRTDYARFVAARVGMRRAMAPGREVQGRHKDGTEFAVEVSLSRQFVGGQQVGTAVIRDVSIRIGEEKQRLLVANEVAHRLRNSMAVINAIVTLTARDSSSVDEFQNALLGRFAAISRTHESLIHRAWVEADLRELLESELAPYFTKNRQIALQGPDIAVDKEVAVALALVFHELATNASKYGSLSIEAGRLAVHWQVVVSKRRLLEVIWQETGGPAVVLPKRRGFGSELISSNLIGHGGKATINYLPAGLKCTLTLPLA